MEAVLMQRAAASQGRLGFAGEAAVAGHGQQPAGVVRLSSPRRAAGGAVRASRLSPVRAHVADERRSTEAAGEVVAEEEEEDAVRLFVGLPADVVVSDGRGVGRPRAISAALRALKLLGVDGVELPVSWAAVQPGGSGAWFEWAGYRAVAAMVRDAGLDLRVSLVTDGDALPEWVADAAAADPDILFADRSGHRREGCLSFAVDELPVLVGKSPLEAYEAFFRSFADEFKDFFGSTITDVTVSLGPNGELRYPSYPPGSNGGDGYSGVGEFQCYDKYTLARLKRHAESSGQPLWGLSGPHDGPRYDESPESSAFFSEPGGSSKTAYGEFFLSWYAGELLAHGDRVLAAASRALARRARRALRQGAAPSPGVLGRHRGAPRRVRPGGRGARAARVHGDRVRRGRRGGGGGGHGDGQGRLRGARRAPRRGERAARRGARRRGRHGRVAVGAAHQAAPVHVPEDGRGVLRAGALAAVRAVRARAGVPRGGSRGRPASRRRAAAHRAVGVRLRRAGRCQGSADRVN
ncbi:unnamed protein product [Urochloa humidicola]